MTRVSILITLGLLLATTGASGEKANPRLQADPRLAKPVTFFWPRVFLGDVLKKLAQETGASIRFSPSDPSMGSVELTLGWPGAPAWKLMDAVCSLHFNSGGRWGWEGDGSRARPYTLRCSRRLADLALGGRENVERLFREEVALSIQGAMLPPEQRAQFILAHPELAGRLGSEDMAAGIRAFASLPPEIQERALRGGMFRLSLGRAPEPVRELVQRRVAGTDGAADLPSPDSVLIAGTSAPGDFTRSIGIQPGRLGSPVYLGGGSSEAEMARRVTQGWDRDGKPDLPDGEPTTEATPFKWPRCTPGQYLVWISRAYATPILSDINWRRGYYMSPRIPEDASLRFCLLEAAMMMAPIRLPPADRAAGTLKQRNGVVLMRERAWFMNEAYGLVPFGIIETLRTALEGEKPEADQVFQALAPLTRLEPDAVTFLARYFPIVGLVPHATPGLIVYANERRRRAALFAPGGVRVSDLGLTTKGELAALPELSWGGPTSMQAIRERGARIQLAYRLEERQVSLGYTLFSAERELPRMPRISTPDPSLPLFIVQDEPEEPIPQRPRPRPGARSAPPGR